MSGSTVNPAEGAGAGRAVDDNIARNDAGEFHCRHCGALLGQDAGPWLEHALRREFPAVNAGPQIRARPETFVDTPIVMRQCLCPGCYVALRTEIIPADEPERRSCRIASIPDDKADG